MVIYPLRLPFSQEEFSLKVSSKARIPEDPRRIPAGSTGLHGVVQPGQPEKKEPGKTTGKC